MEENIGKQDHGRRKFWVRLLAIVLALSFLGTELFVRYGEGIAVSASDSKINNTTASGSADTSSGGLSVTTDGVARMAAGYASSGDYETAAQYYGALIEAGETSYYKERAQCYYQLSDFSDMLSDCKSFLAGGGTDDDGTVSLMMAAAYMQQQDYADAETSLKNSIAAGYGDSQQLYLQLVRCNFVLGEYDSVIKNADGALAAEAPGSTSSSDTLQNNAEIRYYRAISYVNTNDYQNAKTDLEYVIANTSDDSIRSSASDLLTQINSALGAA